MKICINHLQIKVKYFYLGINNVQSFFFFCLTPSQGCVFRNFCTSVQHGLHSKKKKKKLLVIVHQCILDAVNDNTLFVVIILQLTNADFKVVYGT